MNSKKNKKTLSAWKLILIAIAFSILAVTSVVNIVCIFVYVFTNNLAWVRALIIAVVTGGLSALVLSIMIKESSKCNNEKIDWQQEKLESDARKAERFEKRAKFYAPKYTNERIKKMMFITVPFSEALLLPCCLVYFWLSEELLIQVQFLCRLEQPFYL